MKYLYYTLLLMVAVTSLSSCIGTNRLTYLQEHQTGLDSLITVQRIQQPYRVQVNDLLSIQVKTVDKELANMFSPVEESKGSNYSQENMYYDGFLVDDHGDVRVPTLGKVSVIGLTVEEIRKKIEDLLLEQYFKKESNIFVTVKLAGIQYTTLGEIGSGSQVIYKDNVTIMEAIANAGGIEITGDRTDVVILRQYPGGQKIHHIDLTEIDAVNSPYYYIQPNDLIIVKPLPQKSYGFGVNGLQTFTALASVITLFTSILLLSTRL